MESIKRPSGNSSQIKHIAKAPEVYTHKSIATVTVNYTKGNNDNRPSTNLNHVVVLYIL
jgi:hypothetical protein